MRCTEGANPKLGGCGCASGPREDVVGQGRTWGTTSGLSKQNRRRCLCIAGVIPSAFPSADGTRAHPTR